MGDNVHMLLFILYNKTKNMTLKIHKTKKIAEFLFLFAYLGKMQSDVYASPLTELYVFYM